uniref:Uncharacterized protein n=1 Tax=mine drainage metagenome TaxID=410659 RepID=E6PTY4_9ZZZZ
MGCRPAGRPGRPGRRARCAMEHQRLRRVHRLDCRTRLARLPPHHSGLHHAGCLPHAALLSGQRGQRHSASHCRIACAARRNLDEPPVRPACHRRQAGRFAPRFLRRHDHRPREPHGAPGRRHHGRDAALLSPCRPQAGAPVAAGRRRGRFVRGVQHAAGRHHFRHRGNRAQFREPHQRHHDHRRGVLRPHLAGAGWQLPVFRADERAAKFRHRLRPSGAGNRAAVRRARRRLQLGAAALGSLDAKPLQLWRANKPTVYALVIGLAIATPGVATGGETWGSGHDQARALLATRVSALFTPPLYEALAQKNYYPKPVATAPGQDTPGASAPSAGAAEKPDA